MPKKKAAPGEGDSDPDRLVRQEAGTYRTADERFEVRQTDAGWFLLDTTQHDELGQPLLRGPFPTLAASRDALSAARKITVLPRRGKRKRR